MNYALVVGLGLLIFLLGRLIYLQRLDPKEKLKRQILREARRIRRLMEEIEKKERKVAVIKRTVVRMIHKYRRE